VQPDWYMGWLDGALRVMPRGRSISPGNMIPNAFFPAILLPGITFNRSTRGDHRAKLTRLRRAHLLDRPRDRPLRTAFGAAIFAFYFVLFGASATDVLGTISTCRSTTCSPRSGCSVSRSPSSCSPSRTRSAKDASDARCRTTKAPQRGHAVRHGGYATVQTAEYPGYQAPELEPVPVDEVDLVSAMATRSRDRGRSPYSRRYH